MIIDMVNDFASKDGNMYTPAAGEIIPAIKNILEEARSFESPVIYICDSHSATAAKSWPQIVGNRISGAEIISELEPEPSDFVVRKYQYSKSLSNDLDTLLRELGVTKLVLTGTAVDVRIYFLARDAYMKGYKVIVPSNCVAPLSEGDKESSLIQMEQIFGAEVIW